MILTNYEIEKIITEAIGAATMCWQNVENAGGFQSEKAAEISRDLTALIIKTIGDRIRNLKLRSYNEGFDDARRFYLTPTGFDNIAKKYKNKTADKKGRTVLTSRDTGELLGIKKDGKIKFLKKALK